MKIHLLIMLVLLLPLNVYAEGQEKKFNLGIGTYTLKISYDDAAAPFDDDLTGVGISGLYAFADQFAVRGEYYSIEHKSFSAIDATGVDLVAYYGTGLATTGLKAYIGGGIFLERWDVAGTTGEFNGFQINGGAGYNWDVIALDFIVGLRDPSDYENFKLVSGGTRVVSISLLVSGRF